MALAALNSLERGRGVDNSLIESETASESDDEEDHNLGDDGDSNDDDPGAEGVDGSPREGSRSRSRSPGQRHSDRDGGFLFFHQSSARVSRSLPSSSKIISPNP